MNGCFSHCTARGLAISAGLALVAASASAESAAPGVSPTPLDGGTLRSHYEAQNVNNGNEAVVGEVPAWMADHPAAIVSNGDVIGLDARKMGIDVTRQFDQGTLPKDFLASGGQPRGEFSFFFWGDSGLFSAAQQNPRKMCDNFVPGRPETSLGAGDGTPLGTPMNIAGALVSAYAVKFVEADGDGWLDADILNEDILPPGDYDNDPMTPDTDDFPGDQPYAVWRLRYFKESGVDDGITVTANPSLPQTVPGIPDELIASFIWPASFADPMDPLNAAPMTITIQPNQPGGAYDFYGFGAARPANVIFQHAPISVDVGDCYWFEAAPEFNELVVNSTSQLQVCLWNGGLEGDGWMWYNSGNPGFYTDGGQQGPNGDRNWILDINEDLAVDGTFENSAINKGEVGLCTNDPCFGNAPFNDDCGDALDLVINSGGTPINFSDTTCSVPVPEGEIRNPVGSSIILSNAIWWNLPGDGSVVTLTSCFEENLVDQQENGGARANMGIGVFCGTNCNDLYFLGEVLASDDVTGTGCGGPGSCPIDYQFDGYSFPQISFPTTNGQDYKIAVWNNFTTGIHRIQAESAGDPATPAVDQCSVCVTFTNDFFGIPTFVEVEDETDAAFPGGLGNCVSYNTDSALYESTRTNQGCQFEPDDPMAPFTPSFGFLNGSDLTPYAGGEAIVQARSTYSVVVNGPDFRDNDHHSFTVASPTLVRFSVNGAQSSRASIQNYAWDGSDINSVTCEGASAASDSADSSRCDTTPDNESSVLMPGEFYSISSGINDGIDTDCNAPDRDYVIFVEFINCPEVADQSGTADFVDNDLVAGILDPLNVDTDTDMDMIDDTASGCNPLIDYNSGCDRNVSEMESYLTDVVTIGTDVSPTVYFGNLGNDTNNTDTDWVEFTAPANGLVDIVIDANYDFFYQLYELPIAECSDLAVVFPSTVCNFVTSGAPGVPFVGGDCSFNNGDAINLSLTPGTTYGMQLSHGNIGILGFVFEGRECGSGYNNYTLSFSSPGGATGGSCLGGFGGSYDECRDTSRADCASNGGVYQGDGNSCATPLFALCIADQNTTNTNPGDAGYGDADGTVDGADLSFWVENWLAFTPRADLTTTNNNPGDAGYGVQDGVVDGADLSFYVETWLGANSGIDCIPGN